MTPRDIVIKELRIPSYWRRLVIGILKDLITLLGSAAVRSLGITFENYFEWERDLRREFIYTICCKEDHDVPDSFLISVFQKEKSSSILRILLSGLKNPPWKHSDGTKMCEEERAEMAQLRVAKLCRILKALSTKDLLRLWKRIKAHDPENFLRYCPLEFLPLILDKIHPELRAIVEQRLKPTR